MTKSESSQAKSQQQMGFEGYEIRYLCLVWNDKFVMVFPTRQTFKRQLIWLKWYGRLILKGAMSDSCWSYVVRWITRIDHLMKVTKNALYTRNWNKHKVGNAIGDIGYAIQTYVRRKKVFQSSVIYRPTVIRTYHAWSDQLYPYGMPGKDYALKKNGHPPWAHGQYRHMEIKKWDDHGWTAAQKTPAISWPIEHNTKPCTKEGPRILQQSKIKDAERLCSGMKEKNRKWQRGCLYPHSHLLFFRSLEFQKLKNLVRMLRTSCSGMKEKIGNGKRGCPFYPLTAIYLFRMPRVQSSIDKCWELWSGMKEK